ncbi:hypothetical protein F5Y17DRAFT_120229 [Xylariaceae sp. FL0594]|nr:hypothetical protein F5Y17DRAFT_120229 [Xylariaceae sp. FL0594]
MATTVSRRPEEFQRSQRKPTSPNARMKRPLDLTDHLTDPLKPKRTRIAVEIYARPLAQPLNSSSPPKTVLVRRQLPTTQPVAVASTEHPERPSPPTNPVPAPISPILAPTAAITASFTRAEQHHPAATSKVEAQGLPKHRQKAINGIRHELDRLQPNAAGTTSATGLTGRKLRSQEATRFKSELSAYFPEYDEVIGNDPPKEQQLPNVHTPIVIVDSSDGSYDPTAASVGHAHSHGTLAHPPSTVRAYSDTAFTELHNSRIINFDFLGKDHVTSDLDDPLPDSQYAPAHRRAERLEKSIRNTERGRAQHEKDQVIRLLGDLQGHDWLRTMGVNGVTESRKKSFEPAREHFIKGCEAILEKFRHWTQEEKRRKLEKERALAEQSDGDSSEEQDEEDEEGNDSEDGDDGSGDVDMADSGDDVGEGEPPYSDVDAAARQLHHEAMERARYATVSPKRVRGEPPLNLLEPEPREFTSFFRKKHQRDAALSKSRRRGRTVLAWGHPVPEMDEHDFNLPEYYLDEDTIKARERQKRRDRRHRKK